jgi:hypothetical protein
MLTEVAVEVRYPGEWATTREAEEALEQAGDIREQVRLVLGF